MMSPLARNPAEVRANMVLSPKIVNPTQPLPPWQQKYNLIQEVIRKLYDDEELKVNTPRDLVIGQRVVGTVSIGVILMSTIVLIVESLPAYYVDATQNTHPWGLLETLFTTFFTTELVLRFWASQDKKHFFFSLYNFFDLFSVVPYYVETILIDDNAGVDLSIFRVLRVIRVTKVAKHVRGLRVVFLAIAKSRDLLILGILELFIAMVWFSTIMFVVEREFSYYDVNASVWIRSRRTDNGTVVEVSPYQSIFHSVWWSITTLTTVGYGDEVPASWAGKLVAVCAMISGVFVLAMPTSIISSNFIMLYRQQGGGMDRDNEEDEEEDGNTSAPTDPFKEQEELMVDEIQHNTYPGTATAEEDIIHFINVMVDNDVIPERVAFQWLELLWDPISHGTVVTLYLSGKHGDESMGGIPSDEVQQDRFIRNMADFVAHIREQSEASPK